MISVKKYKKVKITLLILIIFFIGYIREATFLVINSVLNGYSFPYNSAYITPPDFLYQLNSTEIIIFKWLMTLFFSIVFTLLCLFLINTFYKNKNYNKIVILFYVIFILVAFVISALGILINQFEALYLVSRFLIGILHSPLVPLAMFTLFYHKNKTKQ